MKRLFTPLLLCLFANAYAQEPAKTSTRDTSWKVSGLFGLNVNRTTLSNWQGGGQNNLAINSVLNCEAVYKKGDIEFLNKLDAQFGLLQPGQEAIRKNMDQIFFLTKLSKKMSLKNWYYSLQADYRSQFAPGYKYDHGKTVGKATSDMNSPGYIQVALGFDYKPNSYFSAAIYPVAAKITMVNRQYLADDGMYGVDPATYDTAGVRLTPGSKVRYEYGGRIVIKFKKEVVKGFTIDSYLDLFSNYAHNPGNIDVVFNNLLSYKLNKTLSLTFICQMIYDDDVVIKRDWNNNGKVDASDNDINGPRLQALTTWGLGLNFKF